jgi:hypothetical protein
LDFALYWEKTQWNFEMLKMACGKQIMGRTQVFKVVTSVVAAQSHNKHNRCRCGLSEETGPQK